MYAHKFIIVVFYFSAEAEAARKDSLGHSPSTIPIVSPTEVFVSDHDDDTHVFTLKELKRKRNSAERLDVFLLGFIGIT